MTERVLSSNFTSVEDVMQGMDHKYIPNHFKRSVRCSKKFFYILISFAFVALVFYYSYTSPHWREFVKLDSSEAYTKWPKYINPPSKSLDWVRTTCFHNLFEPSLAFLENNVQEWSSATDDYCREYFDKFSRIYTLSHRIGEIHVPKEFYPQVSKWLKNNEKLLKDLKHQYVLHIYNDYMREHSVFSPLRANRPQSSPSNSPYDYLKKIISESKPTCDFCHYLKHTSEDIFGRIKTNRSVSIANTFKVDRWHSMVVPFKHSLLELKEEDVVDLFQAALLWLSKVNSFEANFKYPWLMWDAMPHAGASQIHPHVHVSLTPDYYVGMYENIRRGAQHYLKQFGLNFFQDLVELHKILGLAVSLNNATAFAQLTSRKDTEITIVSAEPSPDFFRLVYYTYTGFMDMGFYDFSSLMVLPIMGLSNKGSLPAIIRIASRGNVADIKSEISSFELFQFANLNVDPYKVIDAVNKSMIKRRYS